MIVTLYSQLPYYNFLILQKASALREGGAHPPCCHVCDLFCAIASQQNNVDVSLISKLPQWRTQQGGARGFLLISDVDTRKLRMYTTSSSPTDITKGCSKNVGLTFLISPIMVQKWVTPWEATGESKRPLSTVVEL